MPSPAAHSWPCVAEWSRRTRLAISSARRISSTRATASRSTCRRSPASLTSRLRISAASSGAAFGETPHRYLLTRRMERAAALLRNTDRTVAEICAAVGLRSVGSFTTSFGRTFGLSPAAYRAAHPPALTARGVPTCVLLAMGAARSPARFEKTAAERPG